VLAVLMFLIYVVGPKRKGPHPETYKMSDQWTHEPILWASDEPADHGHATGQSYAADAAADHGHGGHGSHPVTVGGGASGKW
jgi:hypothetical protein